MYRRCSWNKRNPLVAKNEALKLSSRQSELKAVQMASCKISSESWFSQHKRVSFKRTLLASTRLSHLASKRDSNLYFVMFCNPQQAPTTLNVFNESPSQCCSVWSTRFFAMKVAESTTKPVRQDLPSRNAERACFPPSNVFRLPSSVFSSES